MLSMQAHISEWIGVTAHEQTQGRRLWNSPLQRTGSPTHTKETHARTFYNHKTTHTCTPHHTHRHTSPSPVLEDLPASCCQSQRKMGFVGFVKPTDKTPLETAGLQQHKPQPYSLRRTGNLFSILPACISVVCTIEQQLSRKLS